MLLKDSIIQKASLYIPHNVSVQCNCGWIKDEEKKSFSQLCVLNETFKFLFKIILKLLRNFYVYVKLL